MACIFHPTSAMATMNLGVPGALDRTELVVEQLASIARPLASDRDLDPLLDRIGDARYVLLGEASHGTSEFYTWRTRISQRLIREKGFDFIAVEGDWPDCARVNRYVKGRAGDGACSVLHAFDRWPTWLWANREVEALVEWMRAHNEALPAARQVGFYGLDVYSLWDSMRAVVGYLDRVDPVAAGRARRAYECFLPYDESARAHARATVLVPSSCEEEVVRALVELRARPPVEDEGREDDFEAYQNALVAKNAEHYYRTMVSGGPASWNVRDRHMVETLERLVKLHGSDAKAIVWEHNTHVGDARFTDMIDEGEVNVGQLVREAHAPHEVVLVGFSSHRGSVIAGAEWGAPMRKLTVPPGRPGSYEDVLHRCGAIDKLLVLRDAPATPELLAPRGHRAIGVVYDPALEHHGNYVPTVLPRRYDALLHVDESHAVSPLHTRERRIPELPETHPSGM